MRALIIRHDHISYAGYVGERLAERGCAVTELLVVPATATTSAVTAAFPDPADFDVVVPLGAPWSVYDEAAIGPWIGPELDLLRKAHAADIPVLGVCFGAQALAAALGGRVERAPRPEIGWTRVRTDDAALVPEGPWYQWHFDRIVPPPDAVVLARTDIAVQAYTVGRSLGVQFHPEVTPAGVREWLDNGGAEEAAEHGFGLAELSRAEDGARERAHALVDAFLQRMAGR